MKKLIFYLIVLVHTYGCSSYYTQQPIENVILLNPGMTKGEVIKIMGLPVKSEFSGNIQAWHYCKTGYGSDEFAVLFFDGETLVEAQNYYVTMAETAGASGDCSKFVRQVKYRQPDHIQELRIE